MLCWDMFFHTPLSSVVSLWDIGDLPQGPPGTGKTTSVLCLAHELLGPDYREAVLELNASDDRYTPLAVTLCRYWDGGVC